MEEFGKKEGQTFVLVGKWLQLFGKGISSKRGLSKKEKALLKKYTNQIDSERQNLREDAHE